MAKYVPVGQSSHDVDPRFVATFPPSQIEQSDVAPSMADHVPRAQRVQLKTHAPLEGFDHDPGGQTWQAVVLSRKYPGPQVAVGADEGTGDGAWVGTGVGNGLGGSVGRGDGDVLGTWVGRGVVGTNDGVGLGRDVGRGLGGAVGTWVGPGVLGPGVGAGVGTNDGVADG